MSFYFSTALPILHFSYDLSGTCNKEPKTLLMMLDELVFVMSFLLCRLCTLYLMVYKYSLVSSSMISYCIKTTSHTSSPLFLASAFQFLPSLPRCNYSLLSFYSRLLDQALLAMSSMESSSLPTDTPTPAERPHSRAMATPLSHHQQVARHHWGTALTTSRMPLHLPPVACLKSIRVFTAKNIQL